MFSLRNKKKYPKNCPQHHFFHVSHNLELCLVIPCEGIIHFTLHFDQFHDTCNIGTNKKNVLLSSFLEEKCCNCQVKRYFSLTLDFLFSFTDIYTFVFLL